MTNNYLDQVEVGGVTYDLHSYAELVNRAASGTVASFDDGADSVPVKDLTVRIRPAQSGSGDPSPSNVRTISGWTGATVKRSGESESDRLVTLTIPFGEAGTVYGGTLDVTTGLLTVDTLFITCGSTITPKVNDRNTFYAMSGASNPNGTVFYFEVGWPSGEQTKYAPDRSRLTETICDRMSLSPTATDKARLAASAFCWETQQTVNTGTIDIVRPETTIDALRAALAAEPLHFCVPLETPFTYQLTGQEVTTLLGNNRVWADCGETSVTYRADPTILYDKLTAAILSLGGNV